MNIKTHKSGSIFSFFLGFIAYLGCGGKEGALVVVVVVVCLLLMLLLLHWLLYKFKFKSYVHIYA